MLKPFRPAVSGVVVSILVVFALSFFFASAGGRAQDVEEDDRLTILITASRFAETVDETLAPVTVITRKEIEEKQASTVEEVLRAVPGVSLVNLGGVGKQTSLFLRGTESNHVLVLIDGVKVGDANSGITKFENLPLDQIEKIEVVRGPRSSLYGPEAIGGVIQIFTRKGGGETRPSLSLGTGSHSTRRVQVGLSGGEASGWYNFNVTDFSTDGFDACRDMGCGDNEPDDDGYESQSVALRGGIALNDYFLIEGNLLNTESENEYDGFLGDTAQDEARTVSVKATIRDNKKWQSSLLVGESKDTSENFTNDVRGSHFYTTRDQVDWQNNFRLTENTQIVAGADYLKDDVDVNVDFVGSSPYATTRKNTGAFALFHSSINANDVELSLRNDDNEQFGDETTGSIGWGRSLGNGNRLTASYGTAFHAPTFSELYGSGGDPNLAPETSRSIDVGFSRTANNSRWAVNLFHTEIDNLIIYTDSTLKNIEQAEIMGAEFSSDTKLGAWDVATSLTLLNAQESKGDEKGQQLTRRPREELTLDFARAFGKHRFGANIYVRGKSEDSDFSGFPSPPRRVDLSGYATVNLRAEFRVSPTWLFGMKFNNLLDKRYENADFYNQDGFNFMTTLRYAPTNNH